MGQSLHAQQEELEREEQKKIALDDSVRVYRSKKCTEDLLPPTMLNKMVTKTLGAEKYLEEKRFQQVTRSSLGSTQQRRSLRSSQQHQQNNARDVNSLAVPERSDLAAANVVKREVSCFSNIFRKAICCKHG